MEAPRLPLPKITVITPSYNQGHFIEQTIQSVLTQEYPNLEYLVLDGGSTDQTVEILGHYGDRLLFMSAKDRGQTHAINKGLKMASGDILCYLNSDDQLAPRALTKVGAFMQAHPQCAWLSGRCRIVDEHGREFLKFITWYKNFWLNFHSPSVLSVLNYVSQPATFWKRDLVEQIGYFDENLHYAMDYEYWLRMMQFTKLWVLPDELAFFRVHSESKGSIGAVNQFAEELQVARRTIHSPFLLRLHQVHNSLILWSYRKIHARAARSQKTV